MKSICGIDCSKCQFAESCKGCCKTNGMPFGGTCVAAKYISVGGKEGYIEFKKQLIDEINILLDNNGIPKIEKLYELNGQFVNLEYVLPSGDKTKFLDDKKIYLGAQITVDDLPMCFGVVADTTFILVSSYYENGTNPELIVYKRR